MIFELNDTKFMVKFSHSNPCTYAELCQYKDDLGDYDCLNIVGIAECSKRDNFSKVKGRKIALAKLFKEMNIHSIDYTKPELSNTKDDRRKIWVDIYFNECKKV